MFQCNDIIVMNMDECWSRATSRKITWTRKEGGNTVMGYSTEDNVEIKHCERGIKAGRLWLSVAELL